MRFLRLENAVFGHSVHLYKFFESAEDVADASFVVAVKAATAAEMTASLSDDVADLLGGVQCRRSMCRSRFDFVENDSGQCLHWYGFSPVCVRM